MKFKTNKGKTNLIIDAIMLINMMIVTGLGLMIKYVLVPGFKSNAMCGKSVELFFLDYDRHQWGSIHLIFSLILICLLILHIILHWKTITAIFRKMVSKRSKRRIIGVALVLASFFFAFGPLLISPDVQDSLGRNGHIQSFQRNDTMESKSLVHNAVEQENSNIELQQYKHKEHIHSNESDIEILGYMTLGEVSKKYDIPPSYLKAQLGLPKKTSNSSRLGQFRKKYDFSMGDVKRIINEKALK